MEPAIPIPMAVFKDFGLAVRALRKRPWFFVTVALTLGLGIGAPPPIFSVVNAVLLRPLPYKDAERVLTVWGELRNRAVNDWAFSNPDFADLRAQTTTFESLAGLATGRGAIAGPNGESIVVRT